VKELIGRRFVLNSKEVESGDVFVAIRGQRFDGHDFVEEAFQRGAFAAVVERPVNAHGKVFLVKSVKDALAELAAEKIRSYRNRVIGITGSNGKTTTKELLAQLIKGRSVFKTPGNKNTEYGLPVAIINDYRGEEILILEMAANREGDVAHLCRIAPPDVAVLLNVGNAHLGTFGGREKILETKLEIVRFSKENAVAITLYDDPVLRERVRTLRSNALFFGEKGGDVVLKDWWYDEGSTIVEYKIFGEFLTLKLQNFWNKGQLLNLAAAICVLNAIGERVDVLDLVKLSPVAGRFSVKKVKGIWLVDDSYNASPESFRVALEALKKFPGKKYAVVGAMKELGEESEKFHRELGKLLDELDGVYVFSVEPEAEWIVTAKRIMESRDPHEIAFDLVKRLSEGDAVLFKASRVVGVERVLTELERELEG